MMLMIFLGNQLRPAMLFCYVEWSRERYPVGQKLTKLTESGVQMPREIPMVTNLLPHIKKARNFKVKFKQRSPKVCHVYITMTGLVHIKSIMRPKVFIISTSAVLALPMRKNPVLTVLWNVGRRIEKTTNKPGHGLW